PTVPIIGNSRRNIEQTCKSLEKITIKHPNIGDFSDEIIMKDRFGAGGEHVYKFKTGQQRNMQTVMKKNRNISYIIQPLVAFDKGFTMNNSFVSADIRLIYSDGKVIQTYIRMAQKNDFRCNAHAGGSIKYFTNSELPRKVLLHAHKVFTALGKNKSLYSLDFIISNKGNTYLLEGNTGPGLNWSLTNDEDKVGAQKLIGIIVKQLSKLAHPPSRTLERENQFAIPPLDNADEYPPRPVIQLTA
ncbi:ATP-grasp domain-containing protein, partial [Candidatus Roizmanbacteria bacterium]|nr:ATP-grasp domain-containing protein [Candidatus Roizmanbacteria bacterium]